MNALTVHDLAQAREVLRWHFPSPAADETLYSTCARFHRITGYRQSALSGLLLFGSARASGRRAIPCGLSTLVGLADSAFGDESSALREHTVGALYLRFMSQDQFDRAAEACQTVPRKRARFAFGWASASFERDHPLKLCPVCMRADEETDGVAYWHVSHQLPGVCWCTRHSRPLARVISLTPSIWALPGRVPVECIRAADGSEAALATLAGTVEQLCGNGFADLGMLRARVTLDLEQAQVVKAARALDMRCVSSWLLAKLRTLQGVSPILDTHRPRAADVLTGQHAHHPLRWALLVAALRLEGASGAMLIDAARGPRQAMLAGFRSLPMPEAPTRAYRTLGTGTQWREASRKAGVSRNVIQRWRTDPNLRSEWKTAQTDLIRARHESAVLTALSAGVCTRQDLRRRCSAAFQWFFRNDPQWLERLLPASRDNPQLQLWRSECL